MDSHENAHELLPKLGTKLLARLELLRRSLWRLKGLDEGLEFSEPSFVARTAVCISTVHSDSSAGHMCLIAGFEHSVTHTISSTKMYRCHDQRSVLQSRLSWRKISAAAPLLEKPEARCTSKYEPRMACPTLSLCSPSSRSSLLSIRISPLPIERSVVRNAPPSHLEATPKQHRSSVRSIMHMKRNACTHVAHTRFRAPPSPDPNTSSRHA